MTVPFMQSNNTTWEPRKGSGTKIMLQPLCVYMEWNEIMEKDKPRKPAVDCDMDCDHCSWNPEVQKARLEKMNFTK